jgi:DNA repair exonuclease SbcCD ATPase subunit
VTPQVDVERLALYLPVETAAQALADLRAQGLKAEAKQLEKAVQRKMDDLAKAKAEAEAAEEAARQQALADGIEKFEAAKAEFATLRDEALEHLAEYIAKAEIAIAESGNYAALYHTLYSLHDPDKDEPLPELPASAQHIVNNDPRFKGKFHGTNNVGRTVNL